jgi:hypothetical protein
MTVAFLLAVIVFLIYTGQAERDCTFGSVILIGACVWLAIEIKLLHILADLFAIALAHWLEIVIALSAGIVLFVPAVMLYISLRDQLDRRAVRKGMRGSELSASGRIHHPGTGR